MSTPDCTDTPGTTQADTRALRERLAKVLRAQRGLGRPTAAQLAARVMARHLPAAGPHRPPTDEERERLAALRGAVIADSEPGRQWAALDAQERQLLVIYSGLREHNRGEATSSIAAREWHDFTPTERAALGAAVRLLLRRLGRLTGVMRARA